jgi:hypothetical protein
MNELELTKAEQKQLTECEAVIEKGWQTAVNVGRALLDIRDLKLYRKAFKSFEDYCRQRWGFMRAHAYRLIDAAGVAQNLSPIGDIPQPTHESQLRPLAPLEPEQQREVWKEAVETADGEPTAKHIEKVKAAKLKKAPKPKIEPDSKPITLSSRLDDLCSNYTATFGGELGKSYIEEIDCWRFWVERIIPKDKL